MLATSSVLMLKEIYEKDFNMWLETTAILLKEKKFNDLDLDNLIAEIEAMGKNNKRELKSRLIVLIMHLLKCQYQPQKKSKSWIKTILEQRREIKFLLEDNPSLKPQIQEIIINYYAVARKEASQETNLNLSIFPNNNPFALEEILDEDFFPDDKKLFPV